MSNKICSKCGLPGFFCKDAKSKDGFQSQCKKCKVESVKRAQKLHGISQSTKSIEGRRRKSLRYYYKYRLRCNISRQLRSWLKGKKKNRHCFDLLGYTIDELKLHLEKQFLPEMSWDNYGSYWNIDHIKPVTLFSNHDSNSKEFKECWSLNNLRPMLSTENSRKNNKYPYMAD